MPLNQGAVGIQNNPDSSNAITARFGKQGEAMVSDLHGRYYEQTYRGNMFSLCTQGTGVTTTAALATTWTGLGVANPVGSGVNLVVNKFAVAQFAAGAAATIGIMGGLGVIASSLSPQSRFVGSGTVSKANGSAGATISTPLLIASFGSCGSVATTAYGLVGGIYVDLEGALIVPPGAFIASYTSVVTTSALQFHFTWEEVPI